MDWRSEYETNRTVLFRIVALLFALADLAHRADSLPGPVRWLAVRILRPADGVAREFIYGSVGSDDAMDVTDLARAFRTLALALRNTLRRLRGKSVCRSARDSLPLEGRTASRRLAGWGHLRSARSERQRGAWP